MRGWWEGTLPGSISVALKESPGDSRVLAGHVAGGLCLRAAVGEMMASSVRARLCQARPGSQAWCSFVVLHAGCRGGETCI